MTTHPQGQIADETPELDADALAAIRSMIAEAPRPDPVPARDAAADAPQHIAASPQKSTRPKQAQDADRRAQPVQTRPQPTAGRAAMDVRAGPQGGVSGMLGNAKDKVTGIRFTPKRIVLLALAALVLFWPWMMVGLLFLGVFLMTAVFLILGYDGFWRRAMGMGRWYARRRPERAAVIHEKLDTFAMRWDAVLDRFPEGTVDGLYLPDFGEMAVADSRHDAAMERRLNAMRENGA